MLGDRRILRILLQTCFICITFILTMWTNTAFSANHSTQEIHIGALFPMRNHWWSKYAQLLIPLFDYAFEEIHNRSDILADYKLRLIVKDTEGIPGLALKRYQEMVNEGPPKVAVFGPCSTNEALVVGQSSHYYNMVELMFVPRTSTLANRRSYPSVFLTNYLEEIFNPPRIAMMKQFGWDKVATLSMDDNLFLANIDNFHTLLEQNNFTLVTSGIITHVDQVTEHIKRLKQYQARIIVGAFYGSHAPYIFCEAYKQGLYGRQIVWILPLALTFSSWQQKVTEDLPCTLQQLREASDGFFTLDNSNRADSNVTTVSGLTPVEFKKLTGRLAEDSMFVSSSIPAAYDAAWALALALNGTASQLPAGVTLKDFTYNNKVIYETLKSQFYSLKFHGVSGFVSFDKDGQRSGPSYLYQTKGNSQSLVGTYHPLADSFIWRVPLSSLWPGGHTPNDEFTFVTYYPRFNLAVVSVVLSLNAVGTVIAIVFLAFNIVYKKSRVIKMSSPNINNMIILGSLVMYTTVYINAGELWDTPPDQTSGLCMTRVWVASLGFTLSFGALFSKTWRVHILFQNTRLKRKSVRDGKLFGLVGLLLLVDLLILVPWQIYHPLEETHVKNSEQERPGGEIIAIEMYIICHNIYETYWITTVYVYKGLLLIFGMFLAWETRRVTIPGLNDSRQIGFSVYNVVVICAFAVPVNHLLSDSQSTLRFAITSAFTIFCTTLVLCIVFVPKILRRNEKTTNMFLTADGSGKPRDQLAINDLSNSGMRITSKVYPVSDTDGVSRLFVVPSDNSHSQKRQDSSTPDVVMGALG